MGKALSKYLAAKRQLREQNAKGIYNPEQIKTYVEYYWKKFAPSRRA